MSLRPALPSDYPSFARLFPELLASVPIPSEARWAEEMVGRALIAEEDGVVVGYLVAHPLRGSGHIGQLVVGPAARGRGVGRALMDAAAARFRAEGLLRWDLNVRVDNTPARRLYAAVGMTPVHASVGLRFADTALVDALPPAPPDVVASALSPEEDTRAEAETGVLPGQLVDARARPSRVVRVLRRDARFVGVAVFDPELGGANPFRVADPAFAGALLRALRPHQRLPHLDVKVDADPALAAALAAAGAVEGLRTLHYQGAL